MVDTALRPAPDTEAVLGKTGFEPATVIARALDERALADYRELAGHGVSGPAQHPAWLAAWRDHVNPDVILVEIADRGERIFMLPLEIVRQGAIAVARYPGGRHANGNFPALAPGVRGLPVDLIAAAIAGLRPDIDLVALERQAQAVAGHDNPLLALAHAESPDIALAVDLAGGFEALLARVSGKRKRKKHRSQSRKFEEAGGWRRVTAATPAEVDRLLDAFFAMKADRFARMGIANVFAEDAVRSFFRTLFTRALAEAHPPFRLDALEVGGVLRAVTGCSRAADRIVCEFGAIAEDELAATSPGDFLFFENIRDACARGFAIHDFSVGDEPYKRLWCDIEIRQFDVFLPLTAKGRVAASRGNFARSLRRLVKASPVLMGAIRRARRALAGAR